MKYLVNAIGEVFPFQDEGRGTEATAGGLYTSLERLSKSIMPLLPVERGERVSRAAAAFKDHRNQQIENPREAKLRYGGYWRNCVRHNDPPKRVVMSVPALIPFPLVSLTPRTAP